MGPAIRCAAAAVLCGLAASPASADAPLGPPEPFSVLSPNGRCIAHARLDPDRIVGARLENGGETVLWTLPEYRRFIDLADGCEALVSIVPLVWHTDRKAATPVMEFFRSGKAVQMVTLGDLYGNLDLLQHTVSHWRWYKAAGWQGDLWSVTTLDDRTIYFDLLAGRRVPGRQAAQGR